MNIVIDTNIIISSMIKSGFVREFIVNSQNNFLVPEFVLYEIYQHQDEISKKSGLSKKELDILLLRLLKYIKLIPYHLIKSKEEEAISIIGHIDRDDVQFIATALVFDAVIWSDDKHFKKQDSIKIFTTKDICSNEK